MVPPRVCDALEKIGPGAKEAIPALTELLEGPDAVLRVRARLALDQIKGQP